MDKKDKSQNLTEDSLSSTATDVSLDNRNGQVKLKKTLLALLHRWFIDAFSGMAHGLFATLIAGTIVKQIGNLIITINNHFAQVLGNALVILGNIASILMGAGIGAGIARKLEVSNLVVFAAIVAGTVGAYSNEFLSLNYANLSQVLGKALPGNPIGAYVCSLFAIEIGNLVSGKTKVDILIVPLIMLISASLAIYLAWPFIKFIEIIAIGIERATSITPFVMGIVISVSMGILLTMPTSSAAIWVSIAMSGPETDVMLLAGGAAVVGCASHMVGFAMASYKDNKMSGLIAQGIGTSMLQIPNVMKKPIILLPAVISSAVVGPLSTTVFQLRCGAAGGGMGTAGFVGVISTIDKSQGLIPVWQLSLGIILLMFIIPGVLSLLTAIVFRKLGWIQDGDMKI